MNLNKYPHNYSFMNEVDDLMESFCFLKIFLNAAHTLFSWSDIFRFIYVYTFLIKSVHTYNDISLIIHLLKYSV